MNVVVGFTSFVAVILLFGNKVASNENSDIVCPSCEELELRNARNNESDTCHDYYEYVCQETTTLHSLVKLRGKLPPQIFPISNHSTTVLSQENVTKLMGTPETELKCPSQSGDITFQWTRNGVSVSKILALKSRSRLANNGSLYISDLHIGDSGNYSCEIWRGLHLSQISFVYLNVEYPAMVERSPKIQYLISGKRSVLNCYAKAYPEVKFITWNKDRRVFNANTTGVSSLPNGSLLFENPSLEDGGIYRCTPYNIHGTHGTSKPMEVIVKEKLHAFAVDDARIAESHNDTILKNAENLFTNRKLYKSRLMKLAKTRAKSSFVLKGVNETNADIKFINQTILRLFSKQRNEQFDLPLKESIRKNVIQVFQSYSLETEIQKFNCRVFDLPSLSFLNFEAKNLIGILPSLNYGKAGDRIFVIGAHYDTVYENPGIDDNGSGSAYVLEASRLLSKHRNKLNATIYFVLFDQEETGLEGSIAFVDEYLVPKVIDKKRAVFVGAYVSDMLLLYDPKEDVQTLPLDIQKMCPEAYNWITNNSFRGDFMSLWARNTELFLWQTFKESWNEIPNNRFKVLLINAPLPANFKDVSLLQRFSTFYRSDHASFWSSARKNPHVATLPTALLSDMGPWRGYQRKCYHQACDNEVQLTETNLVFLAHTVDAVVASVLKLVGVQQPNGNSVLN